MTALRLLTGAANGEVAPFVGHNAFLRWSALQDAAFVDEALGDLERVSRFRLATVPDDGCEFWPVTPPERFQGPFNASLRNPVLIVGNMVRGRLARGTGNMCRPGIAMGRTIRLRP